MKSDGQVQHDVVEELRWDVQIDEAAIGASVKDGIVTLTGRVPAYSQKAAAERAAKRVSGVRGIAEEIEVRLPGSTVRDDADIARAALDAITWTTSIPRGRVHVTVQQGWLILSGEVDWLFQRDSAYDAVQDLMGVVGVTNGITLRERVAVDEVRRLIQDAFARHARLDADHIRVEVNGSAIEINGSVSSSAERYEAERVAWNAPGITEVVNRLIIVSPLILA